MRTINNPKKPLLKIRLNHFKRPILVSDLMKGGCIYLLSLMYWSFLLYFSTKVAQIRSMLALVKSNKAEKYVIMGRVF